MPTLPYNKDLQGVELPGTHRPGQTGTVALGRYFSRRSMLT